MNAVAREARTLQTLTRSGAPAKKPQRKALRTAEEKDLQRLKEHTAALARIEDELAQAQLDVKVEENKIRQLTLVAARPITS